MNRDDLKKAIEENYTVIISLDGTRSIQSDKASLFFDIKKHYNEFVAVRIPNHRYDCRIIDAFFSHKNKTVFLAVKEICDCGDMYNCCDCGGSDCGCGGCWSCNACEDCLNEE